MTPYAISNPVLAETFRSRFLIPTLLPASLMRLSPGNSKQLMKLYLRKSQQLMMHSPGIIRPLMIFLKSIHLQREP